MPSVASLGIFAAAATLAFRPVKQVLSDHLTHHPPAAGWILLSALLAFVAAKWHTELRSLARFAWACFLAPLGKEGSQKGRLDRFYRSQAEGEKPSLCRRSDLIDTGSAQSTMPPATVCSAAGAPCSSSRSPTSSNNAGANPVGGSYGSTLAEAPVGLQI